jgi:2-oxoglutarate dehydrogenase E2 component (dihydrolipoamide succinyltransferase)
VFLILIILIVCVNITGRIVRGSSQAAKAKAEPAKAASAPAAAPAPAVQPAPAAVPAPAVQAAPAAPAVQAGIDDETVAVISAAVYAGLGTEAPADPFAAYRIQSIAQAPAATAESAAPAERPVWGFAGMRHNTRPF